MPIAVTHLLRVAADYIAQNVTDNAPVSYNDEQGDKHSLVEDLRQTAEALEAWSARARKNAL